MNVYGKPFNHHREVKMLFPLNISTSLNNLHDFPPRIYSENRNTTNIPF